MRTTLNCHWTSDIMDDLTKTIGLDIRDTLRADCDLLDLLDITHKEAQNHIFLFTPVDQHKGFTNPRIVIVSRPSDPGKLAQETGFFQGTELFQIQLWVDDKPVTNASQILDRIVTLFNKTSYAFTNDAGELSNFGIYNCTGKINIKDPDKDNTTKGEVNITLNIGGS